MRDLTQRASLSYDLAVNGWYKESIAHLLPAWVFVSIFNRFYAERAYVYQDASRWWITDEDTDPEIALPKAMTAVRFSQKRIADQLQTVRDKYELEGFVEVEPGDIVVDVGAFIGEFTVSVASQAERVLAFEPDPLNYSGLKHTTEKFENVRVREDLLWNETDTISFSVATDGSESGVSTPDCGKSSFYQEKTAKRLDTIISCPIDFVKVEAEGAEWDVLAGFGDLAVSKIAVDCSEPSPTNGSTPERRIQDTLQDRGYETKIVEKDIHGTMLFARK